MTTTATEHAAIRDAAAVEVGSCWYVWREHWDVIGERTGIDVLIGEHGTYREREVHVRLHDPKLAQAFKRDHGGRDGKWVAAWRVAKFGVPSLSYEQVG